MNPLDIIKEVPRTDAELFSALRIPSGSHVPVNITEFSNYLKAEFFALKDFMTVFGKEIVWEAKIDSLYTCTYYSLTYEGESLAHNNHEDDDITHLSEEEVYLSVRAQLLDSQPDLGEMGEEELNKYVTSLIKKVRESAHLEITKVLGVPYSSSAEEIEEIQSNDMAELADSILFEGLPEFDRQLGMQDAVDWEREDIGGVLLHIGSEIGKCHLSIKGNLNSELPLISITWGTSSYRLNVEKGEVRIHADGVEPVSRAPTSFDLELAKGLIKDLFAWAREKLSKI